MVSVETESANDDKHETFAERFSKIRSAASWLMATLRKRGKFEYALVTILCGVLGCFLQFIWYHYPSDFLFYSIAGVQFVGALALWCGSTRFMMEFAALGIGLGVAEKYVFGTILVQTYMIAVLLTPVFAWLIWKMVFITFSRR